LAFGSAPTSRRYSTKSRLVTLPESMPCARALGPLGSIQR
jgi:hypothetical protein